MTQWNDGWGYHWYGRQPHEMGPNPGAQKSPATCWAASAAYCLRVAEAAVKKLTSLANSIEGFPFDDWLGFLYKEFPGQFKAQARLYGSDMKPSELERRFPMIVQVPGHFVVVLAVGLKAGDSDRLFWWDPSDGHAYNRTVDEFYDKYARGDKNASFLFASKKAA